MSGFFEHDTGYLDLLWDILSNGEESRDRTGVGTYGVFGRQLEFDLQEGFPLLTTKKVFWRGVVAELLWMLSGDTNVAALQEQGVHIWDEWADGNGYLGPVYGRQWRAWPHRDGGCINQINAAIYDLRNAPESRRIVVSAWNVAELDLMALPPCHCLFQFHSRNGYLDCQLYQRSADVFLGVPFNIASYALLTHIIGSLTGLEPRRFVHTFGDVHLYKNHVRQAEEQLDREPRQAPTLKIARPPLSIDSMRSTDFVIEGYDPHPAIPAPVAV